jgi:uncharacterized repeat protein (TIGR01451 family)
MHRKHLKLFFALILMLSLFTSAFQPFTPQPWRNKVDPWVLETATAGPTEFLVKLTTQADLSAAASLDTKSAKVAFVFQVLRQTAQDTQGPLLAYLESHGLPYRAYWVVNLVWVRGGMDAVRSLAERADVAHIYANPRVKLDEPVEKVLNVPAPQTIEWNIQKVNAPQVWEMGYTGQGVVVGGADTGYDWDHPALINQYRGWDGAQADHNYNWFDATADASQTPIDPYGHGTHTMGTMVGDDGAGNQIGIAPGARWIGCRNMDAGGNGTPETYITCYQFFIAPTDLQGLNPDPTKAPDVINNSWGCPPSEGCTDPDALLEAVQAVRAAGILTAHSAGNSGSACSTVETPSAIYAESFTVGATTSADTLADYSSRGPVTVDGSNRRKPDISAPGSNVRSCLPGTGYGSLSGTSMAAPHVAGEVALLISAQPALRGQVEQIETIIEQTALHISSTLCSSDGVPNNLYGWGRIDALAAVLSQQHILELSKKADQDAIAPGQAITYTLSLTHEHPLSPTFGVVLSDTLPFGTSFVSATEPYSLAGGMVRWDFVSLQAGESVQVELVVQTEMTATGKIRNESYVARSQEIEPVFGEPVETTVVPYALDLNKAAPDHLAPGSPLTYTLTVVNEHPFAVQHDLVLTDVLPLRTSFLTATQPYTLTGDLLTWQLPGLQAGDVWQAHLVVQTPITYTGALVNAQYGVRSLEYGLLRGAPVDTQVYMLGLEKLASAETVTPGSLLTYTLTITNQNPDGLTEEVILTDSLPAGAQFVTASGDYSFEDGLVNWQLGNLAAGQAVQVELVVIVNEEWRGWLVNEHYAVWSQQVTQPVQGLPVFTWVEFQHLYMLPLIVKN